MGEKLSEKNHYKGSHRERGKREGREKREEEEEEESRTVKAS